MGLFDAFKKKNCDLCGGEIGLLGNRKLEDGNCCKKCAGKLSPWFDDRRHSTVDQIREQLLYREQNEAQVQSFLPTKVIGENYLVYIDEKNRRFLVSETKNYLSENPDVLNFDQVLSCELEIEEDKTEMMREVTDKEGNTKEVSYNPRRFLHQFDFEMRIRVRHPYFDEMRFRLNENTLELERSEARNVSMYQYATGNLHPSQDPQYKKFTAMGEEIKQLLTAAEPTTLVEEEPAAKCCPYCGAPDEGERFCPHCGAVK